MLIDLLASLPAPDADAALLALLFALLAAVAAGVALRKPLGAALRSACALGGRAAARQKRAASATPAQASPPQPALLKRAASRGTAVSPERRP